MLSGICPLTVRPFLFGGNLIALDKKDGGLIAIGYTLRGLTSKCANFFAVNALASYLQPIQLGAGVKGGCEAAVQAVRRFIESMSEYYAVVKLNFSHAFNTLNRTAMLNEVFDRAPELYKYCHLSYSNSSFLRFGEF